MQVHQNPTDHRVDVAIVGGGPAGLAAATYLARAGRKVALFEKSATLGGRAASQTHDGYTFNLGAHALYEKSPGVQILRELGISYTAGSPVGIRTVRDGRFYLAPIDPPSFLRTRLLSPALKAEVARLLLKLQRANPADLNRITLGDWLDRETRNPEVRLFMEASSRLSTYVNAPAIVSVSLFADQLQVVSRGKVLYVDGGWQTLIDGLERAARAAGALIFTGARVESVERTSDTVTGLLLAGGTRYAADNVVIAASPRDALHALGAPDPEHDAAFSTLSSWAERLVPFKAATLDVSLRRLPNPSNRVVFSIDQPLFLTVQSEFSRVAPEGGALAYALKYLNPSAPFDAEATRHELESWLDLTQPGWREVTVQARFLPNLVVNNALVSASQGGFSGRPGPAVPGTSGLYVAGDWVGPHGALISAALGSARLAAHAILGQAAEAAETRHEAA